MRQETVYNILSEKSMIKTLYVPWDPNFVERKMYAYVKKNKIERK